MSLRGVDLANATDPATAGVDYANQTGSQQPAQYYPAPPMGEVEKGVRRGIGSLAGTAQASLAQLLEPFAPKMSDSLFEEATRTLNFGPELQPAVPNVRGIHDVGSGVDWAAGALGEVAPQAAVMGAAGVLGGGAALGLRMNAARAAQLAAGSTFVPPAMGSTALTMHNDPQAMARTTPGQRLALSGGAGVGSAALMATPIFGSAKRALAGPMIEKGFAPALGHIGEEALRTGAHLGAASAGSTALELGAHSLANPQRDTAGDVEALKESAIGGGSVGALLGGVGGATRAARSAFTPNVVGKAPPGTKAMAAGYATAEALDRAADSIGRTMSKMSNSVNGKLREYVKASTEWTDAKQQVLNHLLSEDSPVRDALSHYDTAKQRTLIGALDAISAAPKLTETHPDLVPAIQTAFGGVDLKTVGMHLEAKAGEITGKRDAEIAKAKEIFEKLSPEEQARRMEKAAGGAERTMLGDEEARVAPKHDEVSREDEGGGKAPEESGVDVSGRLERLFPSLDQPITKDVLERSLQGEHWMRQAKDTDKTTAHMPVYAKDMSENPMPPEEILRLFKLKDREDRKGAQVDVTRDHTPEEMADRTKGGYARLHIRPWSLAQEVSRTPKPENYPTPEAYEEARKAHFDGMPDYRDKWQKGTDNSRKGDLFMHSMTTLLNEGMDVKGPDGRMHHIEFKTGRRGVPDNLVLGPVNKGGSGYTTKDYASEKPAWTPKDSKALAVEHEASKEYEKYQGNSFKWNENMVKEIGTKAQREGKAEGRGTLDQARRDAQGTDAYADINRQYQAKLSLYNQRTHLAAENIMDVLRKRGMSDEEINKAAEQEQYGIWGMVTKAEKNTAFSKATADLHPLVNKRNARGRVMDSMKTLYGALQDKVLDRLSAGERTPELIGDLEKWLNGEEPTQVLKQFLTENGVPEYSQKQLNHPWTANEKTGQLPKDWLREQLAWTKQKAEEGELSGILSEAEMADAKFGQDVAQGRGVPDEALRRANDLIRSIDDGTAPKNDKGELAASKLGLDEIARDLGLHVSKEADAEQMVAAIRKAATEANITDAQKGIPTRQRISDTIKKQAPYKGEPKGIVDDFGLLVRRDHRGMIVTPGGEERAVPAKPGPFAMKGEDIRFKVRRTQAEVDRTFAGAKEGEYKGPTITPEDLLNKDYPPGMHPTEGADYISAVQKADAEKVIPLKKLPPVMQMYYRDGDVRSGVKHEMRPEFAGKSTLDLIKSGDRTATTRFQKPDVKVGDIITMKDKDGNSVEVRVTKDPYRVIKSIVTPEQWSKLEGWKPELYDKYKGAWQFQYERVGEPKISGETTTKAMVGKGPKNGEGEKARKAFLTAIRRMGGITLKEAADITGEKGFKANQVGSVFRKNGKALDLVAERLHEQGYLTDAEYNSVDGGVQRVRELVAQAMRGEVVAPIADLGRIESERLGRAEEDAALRDAENAAFKDENPMEDRNLPGEKVEQAKPLPPEAVSVEAGPTEPAKAAEQVKAAQDAMPDPYPNAIKKLNDLHQKIVGKQSRVISGVSKDARPGENAWTEIGDPKQYDTNMAALREVREARRVALSEGKDTSAYEAKEKALLDKTAVLSLVRIAPHLSEREALGAMYHETTHAAFHILLNAEERAALGTAFTKGTVGARLRELFKDQPAVLEHMKDAEEAAAYGFQIYATAPEMLNLGGKTQGIFAKVAKFFRDLVGVLTPDEKAKIIMDDMLSGRRLERGATPLQKVLEKDMSGVQKVQKLARTFGGVIKAGVDVIAKSSYERMMDMKNPAMAAIAEAGYTKQSTQDKPLGYVHAQRASVNRFVNALDKTFKGFDVESIKAAVEGRIMGKVPTEGTEARTVYDGLSRYFRDIHRYSTEAGVDIGFEKNYFPMGWDAEKVLNNKQAFLDMMAKPEYVEQMAKLKVTPHELWENISNYVTRGESFQDVIATKTQEPSNQYAKDRTLSFIKPEDRRPFMNDDHLQTMIRYTQSMIRQAEYVRAFGHGGEKLQGLLDEAKTKYGATPDQIALAKDYVDGLLGDKGIGMSRAQKDLYGAMIVYQNFRLLPFNLFSSLVDPLGIAVRSNSLMDAGETFAYNIKNIFRDLKKDRNYESKDKWEKLAQDWGVIEDSGLMSNIGAMYENLDIRGTNQKLQEALFKYNLLNGWERNTKIMATKAAHKFMQRAKEDFFGDQNERYLKELDLKKSDLVLKPDGELALRKEEMMAQGVSEAEAYKIEKRLADATVKFVNQSVLNPTAGDLPNWGSNPYFAPVFHLKQYMFTFQSTIMKRIAEEAKHGNYKPLMASTIYIPGMIAADMMRGYVMNYGSAPAWQKDWGAADYIMNGADRSGLFGVGSLFTGMVSDVKHGGTGFESMMGPTLEQGKQAIMAMEGGNVAKYNFAIRSLPLSPIVQHAAVGTSDAAPRFND